MHEINFPDELTPAAFLTEYWQKKPLYMPAAWPEFYNPFSAEELAGLALEEPIPSRIIQQHSETDWSLISGPFTEEDFARLEGERWSLLVTDIEKHLPDFSAYTNAFRFIPDWRFDDLMISYAPVGGSVGPHLDDYDVFLIQAEGERRWQIEGEFRRLPLPKKDLIQNTELRLINAFQVENEYICKPGDMLYLPPKLGHYGVAVSNCMTWSIGFKAPNFDEMLGRYYNEFALQNEHKRFSDPNLMIQSHPGEITQAQITALKSWFIAQLNEDEEQFSKWIAKFISRDVYSEEVTELIDHSIKHVANNTQQTIEVEPNSFVKFIFMNRPNQTYLYVSGEEYKVSDYLAKTLTTRGRVTINIKESQDQLAVNQLINKGYLIVGSID